MYKAFSKVWIFSFNLLSEDENATISLLASILPSVALGATPTPKAPVEILTSPTTSKVYEGVVLIPNLSLGSSTYKKQAVWT